MMHCDNSIADKARSSLFSLSLQAPPILGATLHTSPVEIESYGLFEPNEALILAMFSIAYKNLTQCIKKFLTVLMRCVIFTPE